MATIRVGSKGKGEPKYRDGRCMIKVMRITGDPEHAETAEQMRRNALNTTAERVFRDCSKLKSARLDEIFVKYHAESLSDLVYGFVTARHAFLLTLVEAEEIIETVTDFFAAHQRWLDSQGKK